MVVFSWVRSPASSQSWIWDINLTVMVTLKNFYFATAHCTGKKEAEGKLTTLRKTQAMGNCAN